MKITFIQPRVETKSIYYSWPFICREPLAFAILASLTPADIKLELYDDRFEKIPFDIPTDLVAISVNIGSASRAYEIAQKFRARKIPVVLGGPHASIMPEEALEYANSVVIGEAEEVWGQVIDHIKSGQLKKMYKSDGRSSLKDIMPDRQIFRGKRYNRVPLVEFGRGCYFCCNYCTTAKMYNGTHNHRPVKDVIQEIKDIGAKRITFTDSDIIANSKGSKELFEALIPLKIKWTAFLNINYANSSALIELMAKSGCNSVTLSVESLDKRNLKLMNRPSNFTLSQHEATLRKMRENGIRVYGCFIFGYDYDTERTFEDTLNFAIKEKFVGVRFNALMPVPETPIYSRLRKEGRLIHDRWWLLHRNSLPFIPKGFSPEQLLDMCVLCEQKFYGCQSILRRSLEFQANCKSIRDLAAYFVFNIVRKYGATHR